MSDRFVTSRISSDKDSGSSKKLKDRLIDERAYRLSRVVDALAFALNEEMLERDRDNAFRTALMEKCLSSGRFVVSIDACPRSEWKYRPVRWELPVHRLLYRHCFEIDRRHLLAKIVRKRVQTRFEDVPLRGNAWVAWLKEANIEPNWEKITREVVEKSVDLQRMLHALRDEGFEVKTSVHTEYRSILIFEIS